MKTALKVLGYLLVIFAVAAAVGLVYKYTAGGTTEFKTFYVELDGETVLESSTKILLPKTSTHVETKYVFAENDPVNHKGYQVKVVPNVTDKTRFDFTLDGDNKAFSAVGDVTEAFVIEKTETGFTVYNDGLTMQTILERVYKGKTVELTEERDLSVIHFNLVVSSYNGKNSVVIGLYLACPHCSGEDETEAVAPTCSTLGYTAGTKCSFCGEQLTGHEEIVLTHNDIVRLLREGEDTDALGYTRLIPGEKFGCREYGMAGYSDGHECAFCGLVVQAVGVSYEYYTHDEIMQMGLTEETPAVSATCILSGYTAGIKCQFCNKYLQGHETVPKLTHDEILESGLAVHHDGELPACYETGLSEYDTCPYCEKVLGDVTVKPSMHDEFTNGLLYTGDYTDEDFEIVTEYSSTPCTSRGYYGYICPHCGEVFWKRYSDELVKEHNFVTMPGEEATCQHGGFTDYLQCTYCRAVRDHTYIPQQQHDFTGEMQIGDVTLYACKWCDLIYTDYDEIEDAEQLYYSGFSPSLIYVCYDELTWRDVFEGELTLMCLYVWSDIEGERTYSIQQMQFAPVVYDEASGTVSVMVAGYGWGGYSRYCCVPDSFDEDGIAPYAVVNLDDTVDNTFYLVPRTRL